MESNLSREIKIGIFVVIALLLFVLGLNFLKGNNPFSKDHEFYTFYENVQGLQVSADVQLKGVSIGKVKNIELQDDKNIKVFFNVDSKVRLPEGSMAKLTSSDLLTGSKIISIEFDKDDGSNVSVGFMQGLESEGILDDLSNSVSPLVATVQSALSSIDTLLHSVNNIVDNQTREHISESFAHLETTMKELNEFSKVLNQQSTNLNETMTHINSVTGNLASNNQSITTTLSNLEGFSNQLSEADLNKTLKSLENVSSELEGIINKINSEEGTLGKLIYDGGVYDNLNGTLSSLEEMIQEIKSKPGKYLNISVLPARNK